MGTLVLLLILAGICLLIWRVARTMPDLRMPVCRGHGGDGIEDCEACLLAFCRQCCPEGHCAAETVTTEEP